MENTRLDEILFSIERCFRCTISRDRKRVVPGEGPAETVLMMIAQAPGRVEMEKGRILTGPSGKILDELLEKAGSSRKKFYLTNLIKCPLPGCRRPKESEKDNCMFFIRQEIEIVDPLIIITLGKHSTRALLKEYGHPLPPRNRDIPFLFGQFFRKAGRVILPLPHPSCILYRKTLLEGTIRLYQESIARMQTMAGSQGRMA